MRKLRVLTPELVPLEYRLAGLPERGVAWFVDAGLVFLATVLFFVLGALVGAFTAGLATGPMLGLSVVMGLVFEVGYRWWAETRYRGRTVGKRMMGLRVVQVSGADLLPWQSFVRNVARYVDMLPIVGLVGAASIVLDRNSRRLGDVLARTVVIQETKLDLPKASRILLHGQNSLSQDPAATARIRARLSRREAAVLAEFVSVAPRIDTAKRIALSLRIAAPLRERLGLDAYAALPDEVLLRGIAGVLARERFGAPAPSQTRS